MAKKKKAEEHENLERWLVSYADFMTLLFATFVVLYALAQSDVDAFKNITDALRNAFDQNFLESQQSIMSDSDSLLDGRDGATNPVMLEYMSQKYEQSSYESIQSEINSMKKDGVSATIDDRGLIIKFDKDSIKFAAASAEIDPNSYEILNKVAQIIKEKFSIHYIEIDGHTDSDGIRSAKYPSNWELSSARASSVVRFLIKNHNFNPKLFTAVGYADTNPIVPNATKENKAKNRRVEIVVLKNKNRNLIKKDIQMILKEAKSLQYTNSIQPQANNPSAAVQELVGNDKQLLENVIDLSGEYQNETKRLNDLNSGNYVMDGRKPEFME